VEIKKNLIRKAIILILYITLYTINCMGDTISIDKKKPNAPSLLKFINVTEQNIFNVTNYGAKGDGIQDDTISVQKAIRAAVTNGGGSVFFPKGTYLVTSVDINENIIYEGENAVLKRPENLTDKIGRKNAKWVRTFTNQNSSYEGDEDSQLLIIRNLTFDGSSQTQGPYKKYELEQAALVFLMGNKVKKGRLKALIENCIFKNGVGDAVHAFVNTDVTMVNCMAENVFRGGFVMTGGNSKAYIRNLTTKGQNDPTGIDIEIDSPGYSGSYKVEVVLKDLNLLDGDFDVGVKDGSVVTGSNITAKAPFNLYAKDSTVTFSNCSFDVHPDNRIFFPKRVTFSDCVFNAVTEGYDKEVGNGKAIASPFIAWNISDTQEKNQSVTFNRCKFQVDDENKNSKFSYHAILTGWDDVEFNNVLYINGGVISEKIDVGISMMFSGGTWEIKDMDIGAVLAIQWTGFKDEIGNSFADISLKRIRFSGDRYMHIGGYTDSTENKINQKGIIIDQTNNFLTTDYGLEGNKYLGNRIIIGLEPPTIETHGLPGDIYRIDDTSEEWICTKPGYFNRRSEKNVDSEWKKILP
jgi:hypothetical protein